jgi:hypothetical protein
MVAGFRERPDCARLVTLSHLSITRSGDAVSSRTLSRPSSWAVERLGPRLAAELWTRVPAAITAAVGRALDTQQASRMQTAHAFGSAWSVPFEELVNQLRLVEGTRLVKPPRAFYQLVVAGGHVLYPWRYGGERGASIRGRLGARPIQPLGRELLSRFGPPPRWRAEPLPLFAGNGAAADDRERREAALLSSALDELDPPPKVLVVAYASNRTEGLVHLGWGDAALADGGNLHWYHYEDLPVPSPRVPRPRSGAG